MIYKYGKLVCRGAGDFHLPRSMRARSPQYLIKYGKLVCRGAGDFHLPRSMRARSPHVLFPRQQFQRGTKFREPTGQRITTGDYAGALELDTSSSRHGADWTAPAGDFVLCTPSLRGWIAADATHLHHNILLNTANLFFSGRSCFPI